ncbi:alpha/beta fold hydrolase [Pedobacter sp. HMF7647]|uniref:Alpha/beta fold hydrolase n=1 Tax=Hufsiella arboris TaxID=2695275 RepID=A0A7K1YEG3_9SPHI|nr:alpha/beta fold hydrolase [Hufsiella arboris]MXV52761.1 alpha/beta fold hydrolase [Hufsiella arboris]
MKSAEVKVNDILVKYIVKPVIEPAFSLVFVHGFPFDKSMWHDQLANLPVNVQGIAYDVRGLGESESGSKFVNMNVLAEDLIGFIKALNLTNVVVCGISMGGYIILRTLQLEPKWFKAIILSDTTSFADTNESKLNRFAGIETLQNSGTEVYAENSLKNLFAKSTFDSQPGAVSKIREAIFRNSVDGMCATLLALASRTDTTDVLERITVPTLIMRGEEDQIIKSEQANDLHEKIGGSELVIIPSAGHLPNLENARAFNSAVANFLSKNFLLASG